MKHLSMLISPDGRWMVDDSAEFFEALGDAHPDYDASQFAVKNLGFIKFQIHEQSLIEIELHPYTVELPALLAAQQQLLLSKVGLFRVKYFDTAWQSEILSSADLAVTRLSQLCAPKFASPAKERFFVEPQDFSKLYDTGDGPLHLLAHKWRMSFGHFDPSLISFAIKHELLSRLIIAGVTLPDGDPIFRFIGDGHANWLDPEYHMHAIGQKMENQPDKEYGGWVSQFYRDVARSGQPRYDFVTAKIQRPPSTYTTRYERLLLPWKTPSDEILVTLSSRGLTDTGTGDASAADLDSAPLKYSAKSAKASDAEMYARTFSTAPDGAPGNTMLRLACLYP